MSEQEQQIFLARILKDLYTRPKMHLVAALGAYILRDYLEKPEDEAKEWLSQIMSTLDDWVDEDAKKIFDRLEEES